MRGNRARPVREGADENVPQGNAPAAYFTIYSFWRTLNWTVRRVTPELTPVEWTALARWETTE